MLLTSVGVKCVGLENGCYIYRLHRQQSLRPMEKSKEMVPSGPTETVDRRKKLL
jgi:hypothetical protein